jgi:phosphohistidine phosphatase
MQLYFVRHGKAVASEEWTGAERDRPLTADGRDEMRLVARGLRRLGVAPEVIYTSPLARAKETADLIGVALNAPVSERTELEPGARLEDVATAVTARPDASVLLFAGHEPDFSEMIGQLIGVLGPARVEMKKGACCRVDASGTPPLDGRGTLIWLLTPKQLARLGA